MTKSIKDRQTERMVFGEHVKFHAPHNCEGICHDISAKGMGVTLKNPMTPGDMVEVEVFEGKVTIFGVVRWCLPQNGTYQVGILFKDEDWAVVEMVRGFQEEIKPK
ncbi:MAG: PilZ domain-containing protein [Deltaproteobacteria bacterium]|nr:PilZ domain-containing protein [Deltaproteobacteria bacterium]